MARSKNKKNIQLIKKYLIYEYKKYSIKKIHHPYQLMLFTSYQNRICKYLMKNFQVYENFNFRWYSPYMDLRFINFWFSIPLKFHLNRNLNKKILKKLIYTTSGIIILKRIIILVLKLI